MPVVTFNENVDHHVKGDVVKLSADELKAIDEYAEIHEIKKPYSKGANEVANTSDEPNITDVAREQSLASAKASKHKATADGSVEDEAELLENANKQAVGETLPGQEGDNPSDVDLEQAADDAQEDEAEEQAATPGQGSADVAAAQNDGDAKQETTTVDASGTDESADGEGSETATELPPVTGEPATDDGKKPAVATKAPAKK